MIEIPDGDHHVYDLTESADAWWVCRMCGSVVESIVVHNQWHATYSGCCNG